MAYGTESTLIVGIFALTSFDTKAQTAPLAAALSIKSCPSDLIPVIAQNNILFPLTLESSSIDSILKFKFVSTKLDGTDLVWENNDLNPSGNHTLIIVNA